MIKMLQLNLGLFVLMLPILFVSCQKELVSSVENNRNEYVIRAKEFSESCTKTYLFCRNVNDKTKSLPTIENLVFNWDNCLIKENERAVAVEVSLQSGTEPELYIREFGVLSGSVNGKFSTTTRLIVRFDKQKDTYEQCIITIAWIKGIRPILDNISFLDIKEDAITLVYDTDGNIVTMDKLNGEIYTPLFTEKRCPERFIRFSTDPISPVTKIIGYDPWLCPNCGTPTDGDKCGACGQPRSSTNISDVVLYDEVSFVSSLVRKLNKAFNDGANTHRQYHLCYNFDRDLALGSYKYLLGNEFDLFLIIDLFAISGESLSMGIDYDDAMGIVRRHSWKHFMSIAQTSDLDRIALAACNEVCTYVEPDPGPNPDPDPNPGGNPNPGDGQPTKPGLPVIDRSPKELADAKSKFASYEDHGFDCMTTCKAVIDNFGFTGEYGDASHVFQLFQQEDNTGTIFKNSDSQVFQDAIDCIDIHLNNDRPIIVGINYTESPNTENIDGTDHFVVIIGRGSDSKGNYYTYMETGTDRENIGYNPTNNRLYYDKKKNFSNESHPFIGTRYDVTNVRPNDDKSYNTTVLKNLILD